MVTIAEPESGQAPGLREQYGRRLEVARGRLLSGLWWAVRCPGVWLSVFAAVVYGSFAAFRVYNYLAGSFDFGIIFQTVHSYAFHGWPSQPLYGPTNNEFSDHFAPILALLSPLLWIHDSPTTLAVAQAVLVSAAGVPVYLAVRRMHGPVVGSLACAAYLICTSTTAAIGFDIHENMFTPLLVAWAVERALAGRWTTACVLIGITVFAYEDMGVAVVMFALWAALNRQRKHALVLGLWGLVMLGLTVGVIMPVLGGNAAGWTSRHFDYQVGMHANSMFQLVLHALEHPRGVVHLLIQNHVKTETWWLLLGPVGFIALASPITYLGAPTVVLLMLSDNSTHGSWHYQFYLEVGPLLYIGAADAVLRFRRAGGWLLRQGRERYPMLVDRFPTLGNTKFLSLLASELVVLLAALSFTTTYIVQQTPDRIKYESFWLWWNGGDGEKKLKRPQEEVDAIARVAAKVPAGQPVVVTNDLGVALIPKDTVVSGPQYAKYVLFETSSPWAPKTFQQDLAKQYGFVVVATDHDVVLMEKP